MNQVPIRVLVVEDQVHMRAAVVSLLETQPDIEVVATPGDAASALMACRQQQPDVMLLDLKIPLGGGRRVLDELGADSSGTDRPAVVVLSAWDDDEARDETLAGGAAIYLVKGCPNSEIIEAIRRAAETLEPNPPA